MSFYGQLCQVTDTCEGRSSFFFDFFLALHLQSIKIFGAPTDEPQNLPIRITPTSPLHQYFQLHRILNSQRFQAIRYMNQSSPTPIQLLQLQVHWKFQFFRNQILVFFFVVGAINQNGCQGHSWLAQKRTSCSTREEIQASERLSQKTRWYITRGLFFPSFRINITPFGVFHIDLSIKVLIFFGLLYIYIVVFLCVFRELVGSVYGRC